jgi:cytidylate kinase
MTEIEQRDKIDSSREHSPLKKAPDAIVIDTSNLKFEEQVEMIIQIVKSSELFKKIEKAPVINGTNCKN